MGQIKTARHQYSYSYVMNDSYTTAMNLNTFMHNLWVEDDGIPIQPIPLPPGLEMLHRQLTWLTERMETFELNNTALKRELESNHHELEWTHCELE